MTEEIWRDIDGYNGKYQVSTFGRVKSFQGRTPRILKTNPNNHGRPSVGLSKGNVVKTIVVHRLVAKAFIPNPENKPQINHINGDKTDNRVDNLEWCTGSENILHAFNLGLKRQPQGSDDPKAKLTKAQAEWVRSVYKSSDRTFGAAALARKLGVERNVIKNIIHGKSYKNAGGAIHPARAKLTIEQREEIKRLYQKGMRGCGSRVLAKRFGISIATILRIVNEK